ncbi:hypothetical protein XBJ2_580003 [Xenorhabdus bovienii str. Jollieti]|uniref:Uncharacterized protein n=1 Tax=Xenorhabdus bovienii (strain SS-2004) TaxID=406818 RepID=D3UXR8_XENBS|nr:hypothetical protein XBJ1_1310 [Xenorhabdus bovienii SS-2004]CDH30139.1 hypothetical protein XBJ2_580003 [Xenorhabdus bovienii str. Jollieti]
MVRYTNHIRYLRILFFNRNHFNFLRCYCRIPFFISLDLTWPLLLLYLLLPSFYLSRISRYIRTTESLQIIGKQPIASLINQFVGDNVSEI